MRPIVSGSLSLLTLAAFLASCGGSPKESTREPPPAPAARVEAERAPASTGAVKLKGADGETRFKIKPKADGAKVDAAGAELYRLNIKDATKVKVEGADDRVLAYVTGDAKTLKVKDESQEATLFYLKQQADGDYTLVDTDNNLIVNIKKRQYGWVARDATESNLFKVKLKKGKTSLSDASDTTLYSTKDPVNLLAFACLGLEGLDWAQRFGLYFQVGQVVR